MSEEEKQSILEICKQCLEIFPLKGNKLTCTNTIIHQIKTKTNALPINKRLNGFLQDQ